MSHSDDVRAPNQHFSDTSLCTLQAENQCLRDQLDAAEALSRHSRRLFTDGPHIAFLLTSSGRIVEANTRAGLLLGQAAETLTGHRLGQHLSPASQQTLAGLLNRVFGSDAGLEGEVVLLAPDGALHTLLVQVSRGTEDEPAPWCHLVVTDVTVLKEAHRVLMDEVERLGQEAQTQHTRTRQLEAEVQQVFEATHAQLNLQLSRLQSFLKLHQKDVGKEGQVCPYLTTTQDVLDTTFVLLDSLNQYVQARQLRLRRLPVDLNQVLKQVRKEFQDGLVGREVQLSCVPLPTVVGDSKALQIIFQEYLLNALKFTRTREVARIHVRVEETAEEYWIGVEDNGVGLNMRQRDKAFELFGRLHSQAKYEGVGLGLAVVRRLAERAGGRAWAEGKVAQGATFWVACPKVPGA